MCQNPIHPPRNPIHTPTSGSPAEESDSFAEPGQKGQIVARAHIVGKVVGAREGQGAHNIRKHRHKIRKKWTVLGRKEEEIDNDTSLGDGGMLSAQS